MHAAEVASLATRLGEREAQHEVSLARINRICAGLQQRLLELETALHGSDERHAADTLAIEQLIVREAEASAALADAIAAHSTLAEALAEKEAAHQRGAADLTLARQRCAAFEAEVTRESTARSLLEERLAAAECARHDADLQHATELTTLGARLADIEAQYAAALSQQAVLERQRRDSDAVLEDARRGWQSEGAALTGRLQQREAELGATLADALAGRAEVENRLADTAVAHQQAEQRSAAELADAARTIAAFEARLSEEAGARAALQERLAAAESARQEAERQQAIEIAAVSDRLAELQAQHEAIVRERAEIERELAAASATFQQTRSAWQSDISAAAALHAGLERQLEAGGRDNARHQAHADGLRRQLDVMRMRADTLRRHAAQVPVLQVQLERTQKENRRQFERAPYGLCECGRDGSITRVNHSLAGLLGYRTARELQDVDVAGTVFESATDLRWLLDRALQTGRVESLETTLTTRDLRRLSVRLHAHSQDGWVTIAVENLTALHEAEQRLREAQRLEAVGRVASEVATTCDTLLRDVSQGGRQWLAALEDDAPLRQQGEMLLGDVTRASGLLRQFVVYGHQQISNPGSVNLARALREMAPILKRVLGDDIALVLPKTTGRLAVDVDTERVERILVNVANYARERMPHGGRVKIRLATATVDHQFVVSHPKVRPGAHVLITIEETKGPVWPPLPIHFPIGRSAHHDVTPTPSDRPGIDLGPLVALIGEVGGHLWMSAEPAGNMTLQVHLPKRTEDESLQPVAAVGGRARQFTRWFRH